MKDKIQRMKELIEILNKASKAYYNGEESNLTDKEWDTLYNELKELEGQTNTILANSPTTFVGFTISSKLDKIIHEFPALSLDKTKDRNELVNWLKDEKAVLSWKCDGLTVIMSYNNGKLISLATRGNGIIGEDITVNAPYIHGIPLNINYEGHLVVRGEAMISYETFEEINSKIMKEEDKFKTPRNLASGTIRNLDSRIVAERNVEVKAFELVYADDHDYAFTWELNRLEELGFDVVEHVLVDKDCVVDMIAWFENKIKDNKYPSDGLVLVYDDIEYGKSLGKTSKFPLNAIAFKWNDDTYEAKVTGIEWSPSRTGSLNPVLLFETVNIDGSDVSRASIHNVSIMKSLELGIGDTVEVYLANKIIPQIAENQTRSNTLEIPDKCPVCGHTTNVKVNDDGTTEILYCTNDNCQAKLMGKLELFVSKDAMNIDGLSTNTLQTFIDKGYLKDAADIYNLKNHVKEIMKLNGFGKRSVDKLLAAIEDSRLTTMSNFIRSLGIDLIGKSASKELAEFCNGNIKWFNECIISHVDFSNEIDGFGEKMNRSLHNWFKNEDNMLLYNKLCREISFKREVNSKTNENNNTLNNQTFCITGKLNHYVNRDELVKVIENHGGKYVNSVSTKLDWLINNDTTSTSGKNKKMHEIGKSDHIISEEDFKKMINE